MEEVKAKRKKYIDVILKIDSFIDRETLTSLLARNGYEVKEIKKEDSIYRSKYYVAFKY